MEAGYAGAKALPPGGMVVIRDAHINAAKTGPRLGLRIGGWRFVLAGGVVFAEDAAIVILMMIFGADDAAFEKRKKFSSEQHGQERGGEIDPERGPHVRAKR